MLKRFTLNNGQSLVEILITIALMALLLPALLTSLLTSRQGKAQQAQRLEATAFLKEAEESIRSMRDTAWNTISANGTYHPVASGSAWILLPGIETIGTYTRKIIISDAYRDETGVIVASTSGTPDLATKKIYSSVSWDLPIPSSISSILYLTHYATNKSYIQTSVADFNAGTQNSTETVNTSGGEVVLARGGRADWCKPQDSLVSALTLPKEGNTIAATQSAAYVGTGNGTSGVTFIKVGITNPLYPATPSASIVSTYTSSYKTNALYSDGNYAYLATDGSSSQVVILDISAIPYTKVGWIDVPSGDAANGIFVRNNIAYITSSNKLYTFNVTTKTGAHITPLTQVSMWLGIGSTPTAKQVVVEGEYVYVGTGNTLFGLQRFKVDSNATSLKLVGVSNLTWQQQSQGLYVNKTGQRAYIAFNNGSGFLSKGFFIVDTSPPDPPVWWPFPNFYSVVGSYDTGAMDPRGMTIVPGNKAIIVGTGGTQQYQVIDISQEGNPQKCGGLVITDGISGITSVLETDGDAYSYIITGEAKDQFKIIEGGVGGGSYAVSGTFESSTFDASTSAALNNLYATVSFSNQTTIRFQVAGADPNPLTGNCNGVSFTFVGPGTTPSAYFATSSAIPLSVSGPYKNPARCFRYRAYLSTTDPTQSPVLYDTTLNYSP